MIVINKQNLGCTRDSTVASLLTCIRILQINRSSDPLENTLGTMQAVLVEVSVGKMISLKQLETDCNIKQMLFFQQESHFV